jgi:hypothetical protein
MIIRRVQADVVVEDTQEDLAAGVKNVKDERPLAPRHPSRRQAVVDNIGIDDRVFEDNGHEGVGLVPGKAAGVQIGQIVASEDLKEQATELTRPGIDPTVRVSFGLLFDLLFRHPCRLVDTLGVGSRADSILASKF